MQAHQHTYTEIYMHTCMNSYIKTSPPLGRLHILALHAVSYNKSWCTGTFRDLSRETVRMYKNSGDAVLDNTLLDQLTPVAYPAGNFDRGAYPTVLRLAKPKALVLLSSLG